MPSNLTKPSFQSLWNSYPIVEHACTMALPNRCAIRMSECLIAAGWSPDAFEDARYPGKLCPHKLARGAQDLAAFLKSVWGSRSYGWSEPGSVPSVIRGRKGVICFMSIPGFGGQGHIDLWNAGRTKTGEYWGSKTIWFWTVN